MYFEPITTAIQLAANERLCQAEVTSIGGTGGDLKYGGEGTGEAVNPM